MQRRQRPLDCGDVQNYRNASPGRFCGQSSKQREPEEAGPSGQEQVLGERLRVQEQRV